MSSKHILREVFFRWEKDDDSGEWGLKPICPYYVPEDRAEFNTTTQGYMVFHDVFEHYFEGQPPFTGEACFNVGGEVAAMGHFYYFMKQGLGNRMKYDRHSDEDNAVASTMHELECGFENGRGSFGSTLECPIDSALRSVPEIAGLMEEQAKQMKQLKATKEGYEYKKSCTLTKFRKLYTWGWHQARQLVDTRCRKTGYNKRNTNISLLYDFIQDWNDFFKENTNHEQYSQVIDKIRVRVWREQAMLCWDAKFFVNQDINYDQRDRDEPEYKDFTWKQGDKNVPVLHHKFEWLSW